MYRYKGWEKIQRNQNNSYDSTVELYVILNIFLRLLQNTFKIILIKILWIFSNECEIIMEQLCNKTKHVQKTAKSFMSLMYKWSGKNDFIMQNDKLYTQKYHSRLVLLKKHTKQLYSTAPLCLELVCCTPPSLVLTPGPDMPPFLVYLCLGRSPSSQSHSVGGRHHISNIGETMWVSDLGIYSHILLLSAQQSTFEQEMSKRLSSPPVPLGRVMG